MCPCAVVALGAASGVLATYAVPQAAAAATAAAAAAPIVIQEVRSAGAVMYELGSRLLDWVDDGLHANSAASTRPTIGYTLRDADSGEIMKIGQTARPHSRYSERYLRENNVIMVPEAVGSKKDMLAWEAQRHNAFNAANRRRPILNMNDRE